jgi:hypothetical protein
MAVRRPYSAGRLVAPHRIAGWRHTRRALRSNPPCSLPEPTPTSTVPPPTDRPPIGSHPLAMFPYFRRFPPSILRDIIYTFIWSGMFGVVRDRR